MLHSLCRLAGWLATACAMAPLLPDSSLRTPSSVISLFSDTGHQNENSIAWLMLTAARPTPWAASLVRRYQHELRDCDVYVVLSRHLLDERNESNAALQEWKSQVAACNPTPHAL